MRLGWDKLLASSHYKRNVVLGQIMKCVSALPPHTHTHTHTGNDFPHEKTLDVDKQVQLLIEQATSHENLCQCYIGWCPFW